MHGYLSRDGLPPTRYDKYAITFLGGVTLASLITHHRVRLADTP
jgi:hypothetical protein